MTKSKEEVVKEMQLVVEQMRLDDIEENPECEFEYFFEEDKFSKFYDLSKYYDGHIILTKDNKLFSRDAV